VAGFIGSPAMNFFRAKVGRSDGKLIVDAGAFHTTVPDSRKARYEPYVGKEVIFGIRPEDIHDPNFTPSEIVPSMVETNVDVTELMGNEIFVYLVSGGMNYVGRVDPRTSMRTGQKVQVAFNMDNMHLFETTGDQKAIV
jgi:multiple sugar transport system ATP-binding protein